MDLFTYEANAYDWDLFGRSPHIETILHHEPEFIRYYGYFYMEDASMPVERVLITPDGMFHIEITERIRPLQWDCLEDQKPKEEPRKVGFPMEKIELYYRLLAKLETDEERQVIRERILSQVDAEEKRDNMHRATREWEEYQFEAQLYRNVR